MSSPKVPVPTVAKASVPVTNTVTGLEIRVSDFSIEKRDGGFGALMSRAVVFYQILVATDRGRSLGCRSAASDGGGGGGDREVEDGVSVTFTVGKSYAQILQLRNELDRRFSGSFFPPLPKSIFSGGGGSSLERRNQARALVPALDQLFAACCGQTKLAESPTFLDFFGFKPPEPAAGKSSPAKKMTRDDVEAMFDRSEERKRDLFADDDASKLSDSDSDDLFASGDTKAVDKQVDMFATRELFGQDPAAKMRPEAVSDDEDDDDVDMSDLVSKLKALPTMDESSRPASKKSSAVAPNKEPNESAAKMSDDVEMNDDDLQAYISQNLNLGGVSLDFD